MNTFGTYELLLLCDQVQTVVCLFMLTTVTTETIQTVTLTLKYTHTHPFNGPISGTTEVSRYQRQ